MSQKPIVWLGSSRSDLQAFPQDARRLAGFQLRQVQQGLDPADFKPMPSIGSGVYEIRVHTAVEHRVCYVTKFAEAIYVLMRSPNGPEKPHSMMSISQGDAIKPSWPNVEREISIWGKVP